MSIAVTSFQTHPAVSQIAQRIVAYFFGASGIGLAVNAWITHSGSDYLHDFSSGRKACDIVSFCNGV